MCVGFGCIAFKENEELRLYFTKPDWVGDISHTTIVTALNHNHIFCPMHYMDIECDDWTLASYDFDTITIPSWYPDEEVTIRQRIRDILQYAYPAYEEYMKVFRPAYDSYIKRRKESEKEYSDKVGVLIYEFEHKTISEETFDDLHHRVNVENEARTQSAYLACKNIVDPRYYLFVAKLSVIPGYIS